MTTHTFPDVTLAELPAIIRHNLASGLWQPICLLSQPGLGKSSAWRELLVAIYAEYLGVDVSEVGYIEEKPARRDSAELAGVAVPMKDEHGNFCTEHSRPPLLTKIIKSGYTYGIVNIDELAAAGQPEAKVCADLMDPVEHSMGGHRFPKGWIVVATGNRAADKSGSARLLSHLLNRMMTFYVKFSFSAWKAWAVGHNVCPVAIDCAEAYHDSGDFFVDAVPTEDGPYCTPRSYVRAAGHLQAMLDSPEFNGTVTPLQERMLAANIGPKVASVLSQFVNQAGNVPTAAEIMADPNGCMVPDQTGFQMIAGHRAMGAITDRQTAAAALHYIVRLRTDLQVSMGVKLMKIVSKAGWSVTDPLAQEFLRRFHDMIPLAFED